MKNGKAGSNYCLHHGPLAIESGSYPSRYRIGLFFFSKSSEPINEPFSLSFKDEGTYNILLTDITPGTWQVKKDEKLFLPAQVVKEENGVIWFEGTKGYYTFEKLPGGR